MIENHIAKIKEKAIENYVPIVRDETIKTIIDLLKSKDCKRILEIGTAVGYSGIMMLSNTDAALVTIEKNHNRFLEAKDNFKSCGLEERVTLIEGDALEELQKLAIKKENFEFIFLDGPKGQYIKYFPYLKQMLNKGGLLFADNILMSGLMEDESKVNHKNRTMVRNMKAFLDTLQKDCDFKTQLFKIDDGYSISELIY